MRYERLNKRIDELHKLYDETNNVVYAMEDYCICNFFECEGTRKYETILNFAKENNFKRVFDVGCAFGHQSEVFLNSNIKYIGINDTDFDFWNKDKFEYIVGKYPFEIKANEEDLVVSVLCLTWGCYLYENEKTLREQCEQLQRDFKHCLLYMAKEKIDFVKKYYKNYQILDNNFVYFYN